MNDFKTVFAAGAVLTLLLSSSAGHAQARRAAVAIGSSYDSRYAAQYDGPVYGPGGGGGPGFYRLGSAYGPAGFYRQRAYARFAGGSTYYRGFRIRLNAPAGTYEGSRELAAARRQIGIVERAGLGGSALGLFHRQPIEFARRGHFSRDAVFLGPRAGSARPILLHEFMHVYQRDRLPGGFANPAVRAFYQQAVASGAYPPGSYMLSNVGEFFAMTASAYLNGTVARPPFTRGAIRAAQPAYYAYLARLFGRKA